MESFEPKQSAPFGVWHGTTLKYLWTMVAVLVAGFTRWLLDPYFGDSNFYFMFLLAVVFAAWIGGWRTALLATVSGTLVAWFFFIPPRYSLMGISNQNLLGMFVYLMICVVVNVFGESMRIAREQAKEQADLLRITLGSIGDAVIATDAQGMVTFLNDVARQLTGWNNEQARGEPLEKVFRIIGESTRQPLQNPIEQVLRDGTVAALASDSILINRDGTERPIDDSASPIRNERGEVVGSVLVFRDITDRRRLERENLNQLQATRLLASIVRSSGDAIISKSLQGVIQSWNAAAQQLFGYTAEQAVGRHISMLIPPDRISEEEQIISRVVASEQIDHFDTVRVRRDGQRINVSLAISPIKDEAGRIVGASKIARDITERINAVKRERQLIEEMAEANAKFRGVFDQSSVFAGIMSLEGTLLDTNRLSLEACGYTAEQILGKKFWQTEWWRHSTEVQTKIQSATALAARGNIYREMLTYVVADGTQRTVDFAIHPIRDDAGNVIFLHPTGIDITDREKMDRDLRRAAEELSAADQRKDEFLAILAHELRNPLAPIRNGLQILRMAGGGDELIIQTRTMMERQLDQMVRLVDDLMDVSRISRGKLELRRSHVTLDSVIHSAVETSGPLIEQMGHQLTVNMPQPPVMINADLTRMAQVFSNLLNNAAKYSEENGQICLKAERNGPDVVISVRDSGIGIAPDQLSSIFEMFSQVDHSLEKAHGGLGIGLTLVRRLVEMHGGSVEARSEGPGKGSEFRVRMPMVIESSCEPVHPANESVKMTLRILIVDDNQDSANSLSKMLQCLGNETQTAYDGEDALATASRFRPDVVLLDIGLPKLNGYEVCRRLREQPHGKDVVVIAQTGWSQDEDRRRTREAGFNHHMVKPIAPADLLAILAGLTHVRSS